MEPNHSIEIYVPSTAEDPRGRAADFPDGLTVRRGPPLHPDDVSSINGIPVTSVPRTLIDLAEVMDEAELGECFRLARRRGLLDLDELAAARARVEWRPSLEMLDRVIAELA